MSNVASFSPREIRLARLAYAMGLSVDAATALPGVIAAAARLMAMGEAAMIDRAGTCAELRDYLADACRKCEPAVALIRAQVSA